MESLQGSRRSFLSYIHRARTGRTPRSKAPVRAPSLGWVALLALLTCLAAAAPSRAGDSGGWRWSLGPVYDPLYRHHSVGAGRLAMMTGAYTDEGPIRLAQADAQGRDWQLLPEEEGPVESTSALVPTRDGTGFWVGVEADLPQGPGLYSWRLGQALELALTWPGAQYVFSGQSARRLGYVSISSNHRVGGRLARLGSRGWEAITSEAWSDGYPLIIWDAAWWRQRLVVGCALGLGRYRDPEAGRVLIWNSAGWVQTPYLAGGVIGLETLASDPGALYLTTAQGRVWRTTDLEEYRLVLESVPGHDIRLWDIYGRPVAVSAAGVVYDTWREVLSIPEVDYMAPVPTWDHSRLVGPAHMHGERGTRCITINLED